MLELRVTILKSLKAVHALKYNVDILYIFIRLKKTTKKIIFEIKCVINCFSQDFKTHKKTICTKKVTVLEYNDLRQHKIFCFWSF